MVDTSEPSPYTGREWHTQPKRRLGPLIRLENLSKSYDRGKTWAVRDLDLRVEPGEIFGFLGPNGAGKTTTIKMMVGLLEPDRGTVNMAGFDMNSHPLDIKRRISFVPDAPEIYDRLTGIEYLSFMANVYQVPAEKRKERLDHLLDLFAMTNSVGNLINSYSHGMRQKIVLIGALLHNPQVFILDEPMVGLDPRSSHNLKELMRSHCDQGHCVFFSTHVLEVAERLCDRIGIIHQGQLIALGTMDQLREQAQDRESLERIFLELTA